VTPRELTTAKYTGADFHTHLARIMERVQAEYAADFDDFSVTGLGVVLMDLVAAGLDQLSYYLDTRATNNYLSTARTRRAITLLARQLGYKPKAALPSTAEVTVSIPAVLAFAVTFPKGTQLRGSAGIIFETAQAVTFLAAETGSAATKTVPVYQGETFSETFTGDGEAWQQYALRRLTDTALLVQGSVGVKVNGTPYTETDYLRFGDTTAFECDAAGDPPMVRFGNGAIGAIPGVNATIEVTYVQTRGRAGQVPANTLQDLVSPVTVAGVQVIPTITNPKGSTPGDDTEALASVVANASRVFKAHVSAVTAPDYAALSDAFSDPAAGRVAVSTASVVRSVEDDAAMTAYVQAVLAVFDAVIADTNTQLGLARGYANQLRSAAASIQTLLDAMAGVTSVQVPAVEAVLTAERGIRGQAQGIATSATDAVTQATAVRTTIQGIATGGTNTLTTATKDALLLSLNNLLAVAATLSSSASAVVGASDASITSLGAIRDAITAQLGLTAVPSIAGAPLAQAAYHRDLIAIAVGTYTPTYTGLELALQTINTTVISDSGPRRTELATQLNTIKSYVDSFLADASSANVVNVSILSVDAGGFYVAPPVALQQALKSYLTGIKEVTQTVVVVSGAGALVRASLYLRVRVRAGVSLSGTVAAVTASVDALLRRRAFGASLYAKEVYERAGSVVGVVSADVRINGDLRATPLGDVLNASRLDTFGNLLVKASETITKGAVVVEAVSEDVA